MKIVIRVADNLSPKLSEKENKRRLKRAFLCGVASSYDWSGNAGKMFINEQLASLRNAIYGIR